MFNSINKEQGLGVGVLVLVFAIVTGMLIAPVSADPANFSSGDEIIVEQTGTYDLTYEVSDSADSYSLAVTNADGTELTTYSATTTSNTDSSDTATVTLNGDDLFDRATESEEVQEGDELTLTLTNSTDSTTADESTVTVSHIVDSDFVVDSASVADNDTISVSTEEATFPYEIEFLGLGQDKDVSELEHEFTTADGETLDKVSISLDDSDVQGAFDSGVEELEEGELAAHKVEVNDTAHVVYTDSAPEGVGSEYVVHDTSADALVVNVDGADSVTVDATGNEFYGWSEQFDKFGVSGLGINAGDDLEGMFSPAPTDLVEEEK